MSKRCQIIFRSIFVGTVSLIGLVLLYFVSAGLLQSWSHAAELLKKDYLFVGAISIGFGAQIGIYSYVRNVKKMVPTGKISTLAASGTGTSSVSMLACCLHHIGDVLPLAGLSGVSLFFEKYRYPIMSIGLGLNVLTIILMIRLINKNRLWPRFIFAE